MKEYGKCALALVSVSASLLFAACGTVPETPPRGVAWSGSSLVSTTYGALRGAPDKDGTFSWKGIPYASPPLGELRWRAPAPPEPWAGVRDATKYGKISLQKVPVVGLPKGGEDSLYLNIWRPADKRTRLPVFFWIHGGGNSMGSSDSMADYRGQPLASRAGAVFVSVNYRLGPLGWFSHPALKTGNPEDDSGNFGTLDLIAALEWVRDNIAAFGGDPGNVTIAGESAGAFNVLTLMLAPKARGLFHRAVAESGYRTDSTPEKMREFAEKLAEGSDPRKIEAKALLSRLKGSASGMVEFPYPNWDGYVLPSEGFAAFGDPGKVADVPLIIGTNKEETKIFQLLGRKNWKDPAYQSGAEKASLDWKMKGADSIADSILSGDPARKVYLYRFDWGAPDSNGKSVLGGNVGTILGAAHGLEISFFLQTDSAFGNLLPLPIFTAKNEAGRKDLQESIGVYLASFMALGDPNAISTFDGISKPGLPRWETWSASSVAPPFMILDAGFDSATIRQAYGRGNQNP